MMRTVLCAIAVLLLVALLSLDLRPGVWVMP